MVRVCLLIVCWLHLGLAAALSQHSTQLFEPPRQRVVQNPLAAPLKILTYNVHLLPAVALKIAGNRGDSDYRAEQIGKELAAYDVVGLCEVFDRRNSQKLYDAAQAASGGAFVVLHGPQRLGTHLIGSGLAILSRFPVEGSHTVSYTKASQFLDSGFKADGFAAKGAVHARLRIRDEPPAFVDCFLTHMESRSATARDVQIAEFTDFVAEHAEDNPVLVMGDFNIAADATDGSAERQQLELLRGKLTHNGCRLVDVWDVAGQGPSNTNEPVAAGGTRRIDYIFVSDPVSVPTQLKPMEVRVLPFLDDKINGGSLSDHSAVSCNMEVLVPVTSSH